MSRLRVLGVVLSGLALLGAVFFRPGRGSDASGGDSGPVTAERRPALEARHDPSVPASVAALRTLGGWDRRRAEAYSAGSLPLLRDLYVVGSGAGAADLRLLAAYRARGLRVVDMRTQVLAVAVLEARRDRWALRVTDRLARAVAVQHGRRLALPRDRSSTRVIVLMRGPDARWRVASVSDT